MQAIFLDRDGVINFDYGYVGQKSDIKIYPDLIAFLRMQNCHNYKIFIVTNQSGIGRGLYGVESFNQCMRYIDRYFEKRKIKITSTRYCPHIEGAFINKYSRPCMCRKPRPKMITDLGRRYNINLGKSILIGDKSSDLLAGRRAGVGKLYRVNNNFSGIKRFQRVR